MAHADLDQLAALVLDPADSADEVRHHVESCGDCTQRLAQLDDVRRVVGAEALVPAPPHVRDAVLAQVGVPSHAPADAIAQPVSLPVPASTPDPTRSERRAVPVWAAGLAAGLALVAGLGLGQVAGGPDEAPEADGPPADTGTVIAATALTALDSDAARGEASALRSDDVITLRVSATELGDDEGFHEVWLINVDGERMVSIGLLASGHEGEFDVPMGLIDEGYRIVDISIEPDDGDPTHSGVSLARGELA